MNKLFKLLVVAFLSVLHASCNQMETKMDTFKKELERIDKEVGSGQLDSKVFEGGEFWKRNSEVVKIYTEDSDGENYFITEEYFLKDSNVFALKRKEKNYPSGIDYSVLFFFEKGQVVSESFWLSDREVEKSLFMQELEQKGYSFDKDILFDNFTQKTKAILNVDDLLARFDANLSAPSNKAEEENFYKEFKAGKDYWVIQNLHVVVFRNGDSILHAQSDEEWKEAADRRIPAWCRHEGNVLYNWYAVNDVRGLAPIGYKIPSNEDFNYFVGVAFNAYNNQNFAAQSESAIQMLNAGFNPPIGRYSFGTFMDQENRYWWTSDGLKLSSKDLDYSASYVGLEQNVDRRGNMFYSIYKGKALGRDAGDGLGVLILKGEPKFSLQIPVRENLLVEYDEKNVPLEGEQIFYNVNGFVVRRQIFEKGLPNGKCTLFDDYGELKAEGSYKDGLKDGFWSEILGDYTKEEGYYHNGLRTGTWEVVILEGSR
jgi:uncharacterized protein (TIGR02145 family)